MIVIADEVAARAVITEANKSLLRLATVAKTSDIKEVQVIGFEIEDQAREIFRATVAKPGGPRRDRAWWE